MSATTAIIEPAWVDLKVEETNEYVCYEIPPNLEFHPFNHRAWLLERYEEIEVHISGANNHRVHKLHCIKKTQTKFPHSL